MVNTARPYRILREGKYRKVNGSVPTRRACPARRIAIEIRTCARVRVRPRAVTRLRTLAVGRAFGRELISNERVLIKPRRRAERGRFEELRSDKIDNKNPRGPSGKWQHTGSITVQDRDVSGPFERDSSPTRTTVRDEMNFFFFFLLRP